MHAPDVPELVRQRALRNGAARWLRELPDVVADLSDRWNLTLGAPIAGGTSAYVVAATHSSGRECVLKVPMPTDISERDDFARSVRAHELAAGRGCAELLAHDASAPAVLLERLGRNLDELGLDVPAMLDAIAATLLTFWRPVPAVGLRTGVEQARWLSRYIARAYDELGRPCERAVIDRALRLCDRRAAAFDPARAVLVHGDAHGWNTLDAGDGRFKFVDVEGLYSEREHDLAVPMREYNEPLLRGDTPRLVRERAELLARRCDVDPDVVWEWGFVERVSTGLVNLLDLNDDGDGFLEVARRCL